MSLLTVAQNIISSVSELGGSELEVKTRVNTHLTTTSRLATVQYMLFLGTKGRHPFMLKYKPSNLNKIVILLSRLSLRKLLGFCMSLNE